MQNFIFIAQESSRYLGLKNIYTPYVKRIDFFAFCLYKKVSQKKSFLYRNVNNNDSHQRKTTWTFLYTVWMNEMPRFYVGKLLLHHYKSDLAHTSDLYSLVIELYKYER